MKTLNTMLHSISGQEYQNHIQQAFLLVAAVLRRIAAKRSGDKRLSATWTEVGRKL